MTKKVIIALFALVLPLFSIAYSEDKIVNDDEITELPIDVKQSEEDAKYQAESEMCYDEVEKKFKSDKQNKKLSDEEKNDKLDSLYTDCMKEKGYQPEETADESGTE